jgi:membrane fusion protein, heavy metal efflux system
VSGGIGGQKFEGEVSYLSVMIDPATRTAHARIEVPAAALSLRPGMFAQVEIVATDPDGGVPAPSVAVPEEAVQIVEGAPAVFVPVANEPNTFAKRAVTVGKAVGGLVPIYSGLVDGEKFVTAGSFILKAELGKAGAEHVH